MLLVYKLIQKHNYTLNIIYIYILTWISHPDTSQVTSTRDLLMIWTKRLQYMTSPWWHDHMFTSYEQQSKTANARISIIFFNSSSPGQNGRHFTDDIFKRIFLNQNVRIVIKISLKFVPKGPVNNIPALVHIMAWRLFGTKPLSESMLNRFSKAYMWHKGEKFFFFFFGGGGGRDELTLIKLGCFSFQNVIPISWVDCHKCNIFVWTFSNMINSKSTLWLLMSWDFTIRTSM